MMHDPPSTARREFLKFLAASPYVAALGGVGAFMQQGALAQRPEEASDLIAHPADALNVFDFEEVAHRNVLPGHWAYMASGVDDDLTLHANREVFKHVQLRPRRLRDATKVDMRVELFGTVYASPIFLCPTGGEKSFHPDGEVAVARAAKARGTLQFLSTATSTAVEDRLRKFWKGKFFIKGMDTREDARLCLEHGIDGILVSNHGGRSTETARATLEALPEVVAEVGNRIPVFVDGGFRRGTDVFKALALGAKAGGIGRPLLWGLGAFGQPGVDRVLEILQGELKLAMGNCGTQTVADITRAYVATPDWKRSGAFQGVSSRRHTKTCTKKSP